MLGSFLKMASLASMANWFYAAVVCELVYRLFRRKSGNEVETDQYGDENTTNDSEKQDVKPENNPPTKIKRRCPRSKEISALAENPFQKKSSSLGSESGVSDAQETLWQDDPYIKNGFSRVDKISDDGKTSITSYYDASGKMVYQKEKLNFKIKDEPKVSPSTQDILGDNSFKIKPRLSTEPIKKTVETINDFHNQIDKQFNDLFNDVTKGIPKVTKSVVDEHVDSTFDDIFKSLHPGSF